MTIYASKYRMVIFFNLLIPVFILMILFWIPVYIRLVFGFVFCLNKIFDNREKIFKRFIVGKNGIVELVKVGSIIFKKKSIMFEQILEINLNNPSHVVIVPMKKGDYKFEDVIFIPRTIEKFDEFIGELMDKSLNKL